MWNGLDRMGRGCRWMGEGYGLGREEEEGKGGKENERKKMKKRGCYEGVKQMYKNESKRKGVGDSGARR